MARRFKGLLKETMDMLDVDSKLEGQARPGDIATRLRIHRSCMLHILSMLVNVKQTRKTGEKDGEEGSTEG